MKMREDCESGQLLNGAANHAPLLWQLFVGTFVC